MLRNAESSLLRVCTVVLTFDENCTQVHMNHTLDGVKQKNEAEFWSQ